MRLLPPFARLRTVPAMTGVVDSMAGVLFELNNIDRNRDDAEMGDETAMKRIADSAEGIVTKCDEGKRKLKALRLVLVDYRKQIEGVES